MKILVVCQYFYPEEFQINDICKQLVAEGNAVTVLTGLPNYQSGIVQREYRRGKRRDEFYEGIHVLRCFEVSRRKDVVHLTMNYLSFWLSSLRMVHKLDKDFDLVFVYQLSPVMMGFAGRKYANKNGVPLILYCCDLWPESLKMYIKHENNPIFKMYKKISCSLYSSCTKIICQSDSFFSYFEDVHSISADRLAYIPAFANEEYLSKDFTATDSTTDFVFLGNLGIAQNLLAVLAAVEKIKKTPGLKVHFVGDGVCLADMKKFVANNQLGDIVAFYGRRPAREMPEFYKLADACLVSLNADNRTGLTLPSKVQGYMAAGKPIIGMIDGSARRVIEEANCGICVGSNDIYGLAAAMSNFCLYREKYKDCGKNGREYFKKEFRMSSYMERLNAEIAAVMR